MGRIEDAIRKAQASQRRNTGHSTRQVSSGWQDPAQHVSKKSERPAVSEIRASHIVDIDNEWLHEQRVIAASEHDERVGPYRQLRTQLLKTMRDRQWTTLAITSAHEGAGKTLTAANLAIAFAKDVSTTVLLVDLDLRTPTIHEKLNLNPEKGLGDFLEGQAALDEILFNPGFARLMVLPGLSSGKYSSELLASPKMQELMRDLCQQGEANITIFDLPPLLRNDDAILFAPYADATLVVVEDSVTTEDQLQQSMQLLDKANVIGTILNKARA